MRPETKKVLVPENVVPPPQHMANRLVPHPPTPVPSSSWPNAPAFSPASDYLNKKHFIYLSSLRTDPPSTPALLQTFPRPVKEEIVTLDMNQNIQQCQNQVINQQRV